jgi:Holliday junction resolvase RusA-like endonuclease
MYRTSNGIHHKSARYRKWEEEAYAALLQQRPWPRLTGPVEIAVTYGRPDKRKRDLDNLMKATLDFLRAPNVKIIQDDSLVQRITIAWGDEPGAAIEVRET